MGCICTPTVYVLSNSLVLPRSRTKALPQGVGARIDSRNRELFIRARAKAKTFSLGVHAVNKLPSIDLDLKLEDSGSGGNHINNKDGHGGSGGGSGGGNDHFNNEDGWTGGCGPFRFDFIAWFYWLKKVLSAEIRGDFICGAADKELFQKRLSVCVLSLLVCICHIHLESAIAFGKISGDEKPMEDDVAVWEVRGSKWTRLLSDPFKDQFLVTGSSPLPTLESGKAFDADFINSVSLNFRGLWMQGKALFLRLMLPEGYPDSVTSDYLDYSLWRGVQGIASQISGVLATQSLLYAVGLGKGAIPTAAAINWVLKDGIGYLSKIALSKYGRHFDVNPKGWRLFADFVENAAFGLEILTPAFPQHFVFIGAVAGAGRSAATLIQAATRSCFYAGFAAKRNFAEVIAKGEAQGMVSKFIGIMLGISLANCIGSSTPLALASFVLVTGIHMYCNLKSYQSIQLRSLNPYRASLIFSEYLLSAQVPTVKEVNAEEPLFPAIPQLKLGATYQRLASGVMSAEAKDAAADIDCRLHLGAKLSNLVQTRDDAIALFNLYRNEGYILTVHQDKFCVILKESATPRDMLKSIFQVNYLYWLERNAGIKSMSVANDCGPGGKLQLSLDYVQREFSHVKNDSELVGWVADGLIARPASNRVSLDPFPSQ